MTPLNRCRYCREVPAMIQSHPTNAHPFDPYIVCLTIGCPNNRTEANTHPDPSALTESWNTANEELS